MSNKHLVFCAQNFRNLIFLFTYSLTVCTHNASHPESLGVLILTISIICYNITSNTV